jgi:glycosyltransferase involved in cell wall biosynthesis
MVLVTPVWNDSARLEVFGRRLAEALAGADLDIHWVIADDGSDAWEAARYAALQARFAGVYPRVELLHLAERSRKGGAIYAAWTRYPDADWLGFVDADGAVTAETLLDLVRHALAQEPPGAVVGVRATRGPLKVRRRGARWLAFHIFRTLVRLMVCIRFIDTQCGAKILPGPTFREIAAGLQERGFAFDVELLAALECAGCPVREVPIQWSEVPGSRMTPLRDGPGMIRALARVGRRRRAGDYTART